MRRCNTQWPVISVIFTSTSSFCVADGSNKILLVIFLSGGSKTRTLGRSRSGAGVSFLYIFLYVCYFFFLLTQILIFRNSRQLCIVNMFSDIMKSEFGFYKTKRKKDKEETSKKEKEKGVKKRARPCVLLTPVWMYNFASRINFCLENVWDNIFIHMWVTHLHDFRTRSDSSASTVAQE